MLFKPSRHNTLAWSVSEFWRRVISIIFCDIMFLFILWCSATVSLSISPSLDRCSKKWAIFSRCDGWCRDIVCNKVSTHFFCHRKELSPLQIVHAKFHVQVVIPYLTWIKIHDISDSVKDIFFHLTCQCYDSYIYTMHSISTYWSIVCRIGQIWNRVGVELAGFQSIVFILELQDLGL